MTSTDTSQQHTSPTSEQLDEIAARHEAATPGPWGVYQYGGDSLIEIAADLQDTGTGYTARRTVARFDEEPLDNDPGHQEWTAEEDWEQVQADAEFVAHAPADVGLLLTEVRRLRAALAREERLHSSTIDERDRASDAADRLAYAVASEEVIGEHTADNDPWANAAELVTSAADVEKLRARVRELERPAVEAKRNKIRESFAELINQAREDRDYEGAFEVQCRLREREEQWVAEDAAVVVSAEAQR